MERQETVFEAENEHLRFELYEDASGKVLVKASGVEWHHGPVALQHEGPLEDGLAWFRGELGIQETYPGRFRLTPEPGGVRGTLLDRFGEPVGTFRCAYALEGPWIAVDVIHISDDVPSLVYPTPIESEALVLPMKAGAIVREPRHKFNRYFYRYAGQRLNMRWFGGLKESDRHGWMALVADGDADAGMMHAGQFAAPGWFRSLERWRSPRRLRYGFTDDGYVGVAKLFRCWAKGNDIWQGLDAKIEANPKTECLVGGRNIGLTLAKTEKPDRYEDLWLPVPADLPPEGRFDAMMTFKQARTIVDEAVRAGMKKGMFKFGGWGCGGYDERHPDIWPPDERLGTLNEFRALCRQESPYLTCLHDNYQDIYYQTPEFFDACCKRKDGRPLPGGFWAGGQAFIADARAMLPYARENVEKAVEAGAGGIYIDNWAGELLRQSWEEGNLLSRSEDREAKCAILDMVREKGLLTASEDGCDWAVAHSEWAPKGKYVREKPGQTVPLWSLVFHDAQVGIRPVNTSRAGRLSAADVHRQCMDNMLWGFANTFWFKSIEDWRQQRDIFIETMYVDDWHARIAKDELVRHQFLTEDCLVEQSEFSSGVAIAANYAEEARTVDGATIPASSYVIRE